MNFLKQSMLMIRSQSNFFTSAHAKPVLFRFGSILQDVAGSFLFCLCFIIASGAPALSQQKKVSTIEEWLSGGAWQKSRGANSPDLVAYYAQKQLGIPYVGGLLDESKEEELVVTLEGSDCVIYVEMSLALAMTTLQNRSDIESFYQNLAALRYRNGQIEGYVSRLHYFSDWLLSNSDEGHIHLLFQQEDLPLMGPVFFMSQNRSSYPHLARNDDHFHRIKQIEKTLSSRKLHYIPQARIREFEPRFQPGDVIAFVTTIPGLDISHTALVWHQPENGIHGAETPGNYPAITGTQAGMCHASLSGSVIIDDQTIYEYVASRSTIKGIILARLSAH